MGNMTLREIRKHKLNMELTGMRVVQFQTQRLENKVLCAPIISNYL